MPHAQGGRISALALVICTVLASSVSCAAPSADQIMDKNYHVSKVESLVSESMMILVTKDGDKRERKMRSVAKLRPNGVDSNIIIQFEYPPDIRGTGFLEIEHSHQENELWVYLPALGRVRRLVASNRGDSFFGSDFSYGDILPPKPELYGNRLLRSESCGNQQCYVVESVPRNRDVASDDGYSKKISWIEENNFLEQRIEYYDLDGRLLKTVTATDAVQVDKAGGHWIARQRVMINDQTGHKTIFKIDHIDVTRPVRNDLFSARTIQRRLDP